VAKEIPFAFKVETASPVIVNVLPNIVEVRREGRVMVETVTVLPTNDENDVEMTLDVLPYIVENPTVLADKVERVVVETVSPVPIMVDAVNPEVLMIFAVTILLDMVEHPIRLVLRVLPAREEKLT